MRDAASLHGHRAARPRRPRRRRAARRRRVGRGRRFGHGRIVSVVGLGLPPHGGQESVGTRNQWGPGVASVPPASKSNIRSKRSAPPERAVVEQTSSAASRPCSDSPRGVLCSSPMHSPSRSSACSQRCAVGRHRAGAHRRPLRSVPPGSRGCASSSTPPRRRDLRQLADFDTHGDGAVLHGARSTSAWLQGALAAAPVGRLRSGWQTLARSAQRAVERSSPGRVTSGHGASIERCLRRLPDDVVPEAAALRVAARHVDVGRLRTADAGSSTSSTRTGPARLREQFDGGTFSGHPARRHRRVDGRSTLKVPRSSAPHSRPPRRRPHDLRSTAHRRAEACVDRARTVIGVPDAGDALAGTGARALDSGEVIVLTRPRGARRLRGEQVSPGSCHARRECLPHLAPGAGRPAATTPCCVRRAAARRRRWRPRRRGPGGTPTLRRPRADEAQPPTRPGPWRPRHQCRRPTRGPRAAPRPAARGSADRTRRPSSHGGLGMESP